MSFKGWARVKGAEGKIKEGGVTTLLKHCLHIGFRNSIQIGVGVTRLAKFPDLLENIRGVTL